MPRTALPSESNCSTDFHLVSVEFAGAAKADAPLFGCFSIDPPFAHKISFELGDAQQIPGRTGQPVEFPNNNHVARPDLVEHALKLQPLPVEAGDLLAEYFLASRVLQRLELKFWFLIRGRNAYSKMPDSLVDLEKRRATVQMQIAQLGDMRSGSITGTGGRCGNPNCHCHRDGESGHGPYVGLTRKVNG
jgi:hypothetical protein